MNSLNFRIGGFVFWVFAFFYDWYIGALNWNISILYLAIFIFAFETIVLQFRLDKKDW